MSFDAQVAAFFSGQQWVGNPHVYEFEGWWVLTFNGVVHARRRDGHVEITTAGLPFTDEVKDLIRSVVQYNGDMRLERLPQDDGEMGWTIKQGPHRKELNADIEFNPRETGWTLIAAGSVFEQLAAIEDSPDGLPETEGSELDFF